MESWELTRAEYLADPLDYVVREHYQGSGIFNGMCDSIFCRKEEAEKYLGLLTEKRIFGHMIPPRTKNYENAQTAHRTIVRDAIVQGKPVPQKVLGEYPDVIKEIHRYSLMTTQEPEENKGHVPDMPGLIERRKGNEGCYKVNN